MKQTGNIKEDITNLKIGQTLTYVGTTLCTYRLGQIAAFKYMHLKTSAPTILVNTVAIISLLLDGYLSYHYWELKHEKEKLEKKLKKEIF